MCRRISDVLALSPDTGAVEFEGEWTDWQALDQAAQKIEARLCEAGISRTAPIGWVARNRPAGVAAFVALFVNGRPIAPLRPNLSAAVFHEEVCTQRLKAVIADEHEWEDEGLRQAAREAGSMAIRIAGQKHFTIDLIEGLEAPGEGPHRAEALDLIVERLSSGTTGAPKRIAVEAASLLPALQSAEAASSSRAAERPLAVKTSPAIVLSPFTHSGGIFALMFALYQARPIVLFEKFMVADWAEALRRYRPKSASLVPAMVRMILASNVAPDALRCLSAIRCGTAPLEAETQLAFEKRFGVPVLVDFGATEFIGGVAGWSLEDHRRYAQEKRGSAGRPRPDVQLRTVDAVSGEELRPGTTGLLEIRSPRFGPDWIRTTDLASLDTDGFLYIHGRADDAINRGGFKVLPDEVATVLRTFPGVSDAAVLGVPHSRLGEVPVAFIETDAALDREALEAFARARLAPYQVPVEFRFVAALPRTTTLKVSRPELRALYQSGSSS